MAKQRDQVAMTVEEVEAFLAGSRKLQMATLNPDGSVHLVTMFYAMIDGQIAFWTYRASQKARNLARDPRITCLVEDGEDYFELRGVQVAGVVRPVEDQAGVLEIGRLIVGGMAAAGGAEGVARAAGGPDGALEDYVARAARKRVGYLVEPKRIISWDHSKLLTAQG